MLRMMDDAPPEMEQMMRAPEMRRMMDGMMAPGTP
jgi:hypothetical protein